ELAATTDVVFTMVTGSDDVLEVVTGSSGLLQSERRPSVIVDCSTVSEQASARARAACTERGVEFLAAPLSGDPTMVRDGTAAIACSGPAVVFERVEPYLARLAPTVVRCGDAEESRLVKLCSNLILGVFGLALTEATALAEKGGVPPAAFVEFLSGS